MRRFDAPYRPWLPSQAFDRPGIDEALARTFGDWSRKWFAGTLWAASGPLSALEPSAAVGFDWTGRAEGVALGMTSEARDAIARAMLGGAPAHGIRETNDRRVADSLAASCLDDLKRRLSQRLRLSEEGWREGEIADFSRGAPLHGVDIGCGPQSFLRLLLGQDLLVAWIKASVTALAPPIMVGTLAEGLERQTVEVGARIGGCALSLAELEAIGVGDVLILDHPLDRPLALALDGRPVDRRCFIDPAEARLSLELAEPLVG